VALGLATMSLDVHSGNIEILPEEYRKRRMFMERDAWMIGAGALVALLIVVLFITAGRDHGEAAEEKAGLQAEAINWNKNKQEFERSQLALAAADEKWRSLRDRVRVGPTLQRALAMTNRIIRGEGFDAIHVTDVRTGTKSEYVPKPGLDLPEDAEPEKDTHNLELFVEVQYKAKIQNLGKDADDVFTDFVNRMKAEATTQGGVTISARPPRTDGTFDFTIKFAPGN
jgi:hypothetical protein